ncbi:MAG TPA: energy transducer TonB [Terriglobales bacterium]|nr:energy transducer TonB [Terriglobales bacterium]
MNTRKLWPILLLLLCAICVASTHRTPVTANGSEKLSVRERLIFRPAVHDSRFTDVPHFLARSHCEDTQPPQALTTPNPLLLAADGDEPVTVSLIVGTDGNVHSPLILQGGDERQEQAVLNVVRHWRYRPATCNGVPTEAEAKIEFWHR